VCLSRRQDRLTGRRLTRAGAATRAPDELRRWSLRTPGQPLFSCPVWPSRCHNVLNRAYSSLLRKRKYRALRATALGTRPAPATLVLGAPHKSDRHGTGPRRHAEHRAFTPTCRWMRHARSWTRDALQAGERVQQRRRLSGATTGCTTLSQQGGLLPGDSGDSTA
jgi:hypothetical protein